MQLVRIWREEPDGSNFAGQRPLPTLVKIEIEIDATLEAVRTTRPTNRWIEQRTQIQDHMSVLDANAQQKQTFDTHPLGLIRRWKPGPNCKPED